MSKVKRDAWRKFTGWYEDILIKAEIYDWRYPVKGSGVWMPYGFELRKRVYEILRKLHIEAGYSEVLFPTLIPEDLFKREAEHVASFEKEVFWVTRGGLTELDKKLVLRPTSETAMYYMFSLWLNSYRDLPLRIFQCVNVFRYETKATHPLYREREISTFFESHSAFLTAEEAEEEVRRAVKMYMKFFDSLGIPYIISKRPSWDKFPGAVYSIAFDTIMPNGRLLQIGTVHNLGQNFSKPFDIKVLTAEGENVYVWQMCFGVSGRVITALIAVHGDDHGPVFPPNVAPIQIVVIPIPYKGKEEVVKEKAQEVYELLRRAGFRIALDLSEETPGSKYYKWELKGVPIRIEIGPKEVEGNYVIVTRRDTLERRRVPENELIDFIKRLEHEMLQDMRERAWKFLRENIAQVKSIEEATRKLNRGMTVVMPWCGDEACGQEIEERLEARVLGIKLSPDTKPLAPPKGAKCSNCGKDAKYLLVVGKSY